MKIPSLIRDWALPIAMLSGIVAYFLYVNIPLFDNTHAFAGKVIGYLQPGLIFMMLFVTFCKIKLSELTLCKWHFFLLAFQLLAFIILSMLAAMIPNLSEGGRVLIESGMICLICPTATAAAVITAKLGGNAASLLSYTLLINFAVAVVAPIFLTIAHPVEGRSFAASSIEILSKVLPLLICPLLLAQLCRRLLPSLCKKIAGYPNLAFLLWLVALSMAIGITVKAIMHSNLPAWIECGIAIVSLLCCVIQFATGRAIGRKYGETITAGQSLGQKNTVFAIWLAYTFLTPVTAIAGGFYSIWHNSVNTWQLYRLRKKYK